jgi:hypothetical protein
MLDEDKNFIYASWLRGLYYGESWFSEIPKNIFMENYHKVIDSILKKSSTVVKVACLKDDPSVILGYAVLVDTGGLHWVFIKKSWRNIGIAKDLVGSVSYCSHLTNVGISIMKKKGWIFNPFII